MTTRWLPREGLALAAVTVAGLGAFAGPLTVGAASSQPAALFTGLVATAAIVLLAIGLQTHHLSTRLLAVLAALVALDATLRLVLVIGLLGFSPIFFLIIVGGYVMGPSFGFALGSLTLLLSAVLTAGVGPWLPYQMLAAAWVGMGAGYVGRLCAASTAPGSLALLAVYGCVAGFAYGVLLDLWEWPVFLSGASSPLGWAPHLALAEMGRRFGAFYLATSLLYDAFRAAGNLLLLALLGMPVIAALARFKRRFLVDWVPTANMQGDVGTPA
ncbi:MAG TPA: ECF transporter S component [Candidatus Dormibacteraeota bacterium]|jgi:energy-coupling factor transport system substrate-specific component